MSITRHFILNAAVLVSAMVAGGVAGQPAPASAALVPVRSEPQDPPSASGAPAAPDGCQAGIGNFFGTWMAVVTWNDNSSNEDGFIIEWRITPHGASGTVTVPANTTSAWFLPAGQSDGQKGKYRVKAFNAFGESGWSNWASAETP